jgi:hypothetical protein
MACGIGREWPAKPEPKYDKQDGDAFDVDIYQRLEHMAALCGMASTIKSCTVLPSTEFGASGSWLNGLIVTNHGFEAHPIPQSQKPSPKVASCSTTHILPNGGR